jgi:hypothetical protein
MESTIRKNAGKLMGFDPHAARGIQRDVHRPMERIRGFMQSH